MILGCLQPLFWCGWRHMTNSAIWKQNLGLCLSCSPKALNTKTQANKNLIRIENEHKTSHVLIVCLNNRCPYSLFIPTKLSVLLASAFVRSKFKKGKINSSIDSSTYSIEITLLAPKGGICLNSMKNDYFLATRGFLKETRSHSFPPLSCTRYAAQPGSAISFLCPRKIKRTKQSNQISKNKNHQKV